MIEKSIASAVLFVWEENMGVIKHCLSVYTLADTGEMFAEAWMLIKIFGKRICLFKRREKIPRA